MTDPAPIILIGAARSGTKILRDLLAVSSGVRAVPYDINYVWRYGAQGHDMLDPETLTGRRARFIRRTIPRLAGARPGEVVVEKTVSNTLRVPFVDRVFPDARYVHLIRDGRDVAESAMRQWQAPPDWRALARKLRGMPLSNAGYVAWFGGNMLRGLVSGRGGGNVWGPRYPGVHEDAAEGLATACTRQWVASVERARADLAALSGDRVFEIRYEDMVAQPDRVGDLARSLGLPDPDAVAEAARSCLRPAPPRAWCNLPETDRSVFDAVLSPSLMRFGYTQ